MMTEKDFRHMCYMCFGMMDAVTDTRGHSPLSLASLSGQALSARFLNKYPYGQEFGYDYVHWQVQKPPMSEWQYWLNKGPGHNPYWVCEIEGHDCESYGNPESGFESVQCNRCDWGFNCYH